MSGIRGPWGSGRQPVAGDLFAEIAKLRLERDAAIEALKQQMEDNLKLHREVDELRARNQRLSAAVEDWDVEGTPI